MSTWSRKDWDRTESGPSNRALALVHDLEAAEGQLAPLLPNEFLAELKEDPACSHWYAGDELLGFGLLRPDGVFRAVLRPEHREMSLFLPMLAWAESVRQARYPDSTLQVVAQDDDVCLPFLLLRLGFIAAENGWSRSDEAVVFRFYAGGRVEEAGL